jgi:hypothetical protein
MTADDPDDVDDAGDGDAAGDGPLPEAVIEEAERLTRLAREAVDEAEATAYRQERDELVAGHDYEARVREDDDTLVLHPEEWLADGTVQVDRVEDVDRGVEVPLSGPGDAEDWATVEAQNRALAETVAETHGEPHGATAHALADFAGNHYAKLVEDLTGDELAAFRKEYLPRNAWPTDEQLDALADSIERIYAAADAPVPGERDG